MTTAQRLAIESPAIGLLVFDTDENSFSYYNGGDWKSIEAAALSSFNGVTSATNNSDDWVFSAETLDYGGSQESKFLFDNSKGAFRTGAINNRNWDENQRGDYSFGAGYNVQATETAAIALGYQTTANNFGTTAFGFNTTASFEFATAFGRNSTASGLSATAFGESTLASGNTAVAFGIGTTASGTHSTAFGANNTASGTYATAWGWQNEAYSFGETVFGLLL